ncbi:MAG: hypothetical protein ACOYYF_15280 [Chloroflexota bacterium]
MNAITKNRLTEIVDTVNAEHDKLETMLRDSMARASENRIRCLRYLGESLKILEGKGGDA